MRRIYLLIALFFVCTASRAQKGSTATVTFPQSFVGNWKGTLEWFLPAKEAKKIPMELRIQPVNDSAGQYTWNLIYGEAKEDNRPYILKPVDTAVGHWITDELNGILLDEYWLGNKLHAVFTVEPVTIINNYWLENGNLIMEFISMQAKPISTTGKGTEESPYVGSYGVKSYQKAVLKKY